MMAPNDALVCCRVSVLTGVCKVSDENIYYGQLQVS